MNKEKMHSIFAWIVLLLIAAFTLWHFAGCTDNTAPYDPEITETEPPELRDTFKFITDDGMDVRIRSEYRAMFVMHHCCNYVWQCGKVDSTLNMVSPLYCVHNNTEDIGEVLGNFANDSIDIQIIAEHQGNGVYSQGPCNQIRIATPNYEDVCDLTVPGSYTCP